MDLESLSKDAGAIVKAQLVQAFQEGFEGKGFADVIFSIRLGPKPPFDELEKGMLGQCRPLTD